MVPDVFQPVGRLFLEFFRTSRLNSISRIKFRAILIAPSQAFFTCDGIDGSPVAIREPTLLFFYGPMPFQDLSVTPSMALRSFSYLVQQDPVSIGNGTGKSPIGIHGPPVAFFP
ncbi:hypothetical protein HAX54_006093 [Datura stramonium]|uniref:Uncharacterized protein n=1 Tax=Datura stramonium TaxID=4076 RepID=A0ABS8TAY3_DATST|nr:hypothetical protein [Datura stramonium]